MKLPQQDSATGRALKTAVQVVIGLLLAIWVVPGVPHAVVSYFQANLVPVALSLGIPTGIVTFVWNLIRKNVPNY